MLDIENSIVTLDAMGCQSEIAQQVIRQKADYILAPRVTIGPLVLNIMRKIAMVLFKQDDTKRASMAAKKKMAGLDDEYRSTLL